jgi:hypothetical protein
MEHRCSIVSSIFEPESLLGSQTSAMAAMVDRNERISLGEGFIGGEVLEISRCRPAMEQQQRWYRPIAVKMTADEELAATGHLHRQRLGQPRQLQWFAIARYNG